MFFLNVLGLLSCIFISALLLRYFKAGIIVFLLECPRGYTLIGYITNLSEKNSCRPMRNCVIKNMS